MLAASHESSGPPIGVCVIPAPAPNQPRVAANTDYIREIFAHAGVCCRFVEPAELPVALPGLRILVTAGEGEPPADVRAALRAWVESGGAWIAVTGTLGLEDLLGVVLERPAHSSWGGGIGSLGEGYLDSRSAFDGKTSAESSSAPDAAGPADAGEEAEAAILGHLKHPLHFFNGIPARAEGGVILASVLDAHQRPGGRAGMVHHRAGDGQTLFIAPDLAGTVVRIQQGIPVTRDGVSAPDGTAPIADGVLKSGDGGVLDWIFDRQPVKGAEGLQAYLAPVADLWREVLLRAVFFMARSQRTALPVLWLYPRNLPAIAHLSHDTDGSDPVAGKLLLEALRACGVQSTWCVILPGYPAALLEEIRQDGHELALHFDAMTDVQDWSENAFDEQWRAVSALLGRAPVTNKNHYLRWEGDTEFFDWCVPRGIRLDQSRGASKTGEAGYNFGTCHPYFPAAPDGRLIDVLELATPTQDLIVFAPEPLLDALLASVLQSHGILHLLFHPAHIGKPGVRTALENAVSSARGNGLEWWTAEAIDRWERARRRITWDEVQIGAGALALRIGVPAELGDAVMLVLSECEGRSSVDGVPTKGEMVERWGFSFHSIMLDPASTPGAVREGVPTDPETAPRSVCVEWMDD